MKTILIIGAVWPEPNSSAAGSRMLQLVDLFLSRGMRVVFASVAKQSPHAFQLETIAVEVVAIELNSSTFDAFVSNLSPDIVLFDRFMTEEQFGWRVAEHCPQAARILNTEDLHFLRDARWKKVKASSGESWCWDELTSAEIQTDLAKREIAAILRSDLTIIISQAEQALLVDRFAIPAQLLQYTPFLLEPIESVADWPAFKHRQHFISIGNFRHAPNWDAVLQLKYAIWPRLSERLPSAEMHIYGAYPPQKATDLTNRKERFIVKGWASDSDEVLRQARVLLAPLRFGAGLKGKFISAMQAGTPSVTTPIGAEGINGDLAWCGSVVADKDAFIDEAVGLYQNAEEWHRAQQNGIEIINQRFNRAEHSERLFGRIETLLQNLEQERRANFIGSMLRYHSLQSTRYMSRWIEAKNKAT